ncbi:(2Fe-2S)-binding protein [Pararoseomonas indoligenes]|uniref:(2Fe-2S)-binding protein n=1 Tax=Roseomonas indoligenes TaxID=2820811 RepID=A0A940S849_9PROT|nr:(2Fe-2S)-binding protein [Pararoseomonas indoligenes]MBP0495719.1 (2Fe-2S)-binding protein [Pararoseomonas indoligenes]
MRLSLHVNGTTRAVEAEPRDTLADTLRDGAALTALHLGCEGGSCGACTVLLDGEPVRSCIVLAVTVEGREVRTLEGLAGDSVTEALKRAFHEEHALQCGYCTPGMLVTARDILRRFPGPDEAMIRRELAGQICRCTGYMGIVAAIRRVGEALQETSGAGA